MAAKGGLIKWGPTKKWLLEQVKKRRPWWKCTRVSHEVHTRLEFVAAEVVRLVLRDGELRGVAKDETPDIVLIVRSALAAVVVDGYLVRNPYVRDIKLKTDELVAAVNAAVKARALGLIAQHGTFGTTLTTG